MKRIEKRKLSSTQIAAIVFAAILLLLVGLYIIVNSIETNSSASSEPPELWEGESLYLNVPLAYPAVSESRIQSILVQQGDKIFDFTRPDKNGSFWLGYGDRSEGIEGMVQYIPPIVGAEGGFDYESLYSIEENDGYGRIYLLTYLCVAIGTNGFDQRIPLPTGEDEKSQKDRENLLLEYGVDDENAVIISFGYTDKDGDGNETVKSHVIHLGKRPVTGVGFYYRVDGRDCIYYTASNYFEYALGGFYSFVKGMLVAEGLDMDLSFEPYLTTDFKSWINEKHKTDGERVLDGSKVIVEGRAALPVISGADFNPDADGYSRTEVDYLTLDLSAFRSRVDYERIRNILTGLCVNEDYTVSTEGGVPTITLILNRSESETMLIDFARRFEISIASVDGIVAGGETLTEGKVGENNSVLVSGSYTEGGGEPIIFSSAPLELLDARLPEGAVSAIRDASVGALEKPYTFEMEIALTERTYTYEIKEIEAAIDALGENYTLGAPTADADYVKVAYTLTVDDARDSLTRHALISLTDAKIPAAVRESLASASVGVLASPIEFEIEYTKENAQSINQALVIKEITAVFAPTGMTADKVGADSYVNILYYERINGAKGEDKTVTLSMADIKSSKKWAEAYDLLLGKAAGTRLDRTVYSEDRFYEATLDFISYEINRVDCFITSKMTGSFRYVNASDRDPYYGESFFENTINNEYKLYGLNSSACETVVRLLGGIYMEGSSNHSEGLSGKTVALGLTHENMEKYGLYAHTVYFELPRGVYETVREQPEYDDSYVPSVSDEVVDYAWYSTLGFTLYISEERDGKRYIGSDMYDLIAEVDAEGFVFLELDFIDAFARRNLLLTNLTEITELDVDFYMDDVYGSYDFDVSVKRVYLVQGDGYVKVLGNKPTGQSYTASEMYTVSAMASSDSMSTHLKDLNEKYGQSIGVDALYNYTVGGGNELPKTSATETVGVANFRRYFHLLITTEYDGTLSDADKEAVKSARLLMTLKIKLRNNDDLYYAYDFYRIDDRRVAVSIYKTDGEGVIDTESVTLDFYMSTYSFKMLAMNFVGLVNGVELDTSVGYPEYPAYPEK